MSCKGTTHYRSDNSSSCSCGYIKAFPSDYPVYMKKDLEEVTSVPDNKSAAGAEKPLAARLSLLEQAFLMEMAKVGDFGCRKYAINDWRTNPKVTVDARIDSLLRHVGKFSSSAFDDLDDETNLSHLAHAAFNAMMLWWIVKYKPERDDRWKPSNEK